MRRGFTLLELIVVIIILGVLATLGFTQYIKMVEKGRTAEAKTILGQLRTSQEAYNLEYGSRTANMADLAVDAPTACVVTHYFAYSTSATTGTATRCTAGAKAPPGPAQYTVTMTYTSGTWGGSAGYY